MPGCTLEREVNGATALYRVSGRFEGACAWQLCGRLEQEPLHTVVVDFSRVSEFVDYGIAVLATAMLALDKQLELRGLRQHQERLFRYFGVDHFRAATEAQPRFEASPGPTSEVR